MGCRLLLGKLCQNVSRAMKSGAPGKTRTCDLLVRSQTLYPTELRAHLKKVNSAIHCRGCQGAETAMMPVKIAGRAGISTKRRMLYRPERLSSNQRRS